MLNRLPRMMPGLQEMVYDIGNPSHKELAKALHVSERTVYRWMADEFAPRSAMLAVFWLTRWGHSAVHCEAHNSAVFTAQENRALRERITSLEKQLASMGLLADFGTANDPSRDVVCSVPPPVTLWEVAAPGATRPVRSKQASGKSRAA